LADKEQQKEAKALAVRQPEILVLPEKDELVHKLKSIRSFQATVRELLIDGSDYGTIPGTPKPTLLKPGAEKITKLLNLCEKYETMDCIRDFQKGIFHFEMKCKMFIIGTDTQVCEGVGECNSYESRYRYRWVAEDDVPEGTDKKSLKKRGGVRSEFAFAIQRAETSGQYGKPAEYWQMFQDAIDKGTARKIQKKTRKSEMMDAWEIDSTVYRVANEDIYDQVNTILKIAKKRAFVDASLSVGRLSELFTQDLEDKNEDIVLPAKDVTPPQEKPKAKAPETRRIGDHRNAISDAQRKRLYAIAKNEGKREDEELKAMVQNCGLTSSKDITRDMYESWILWAQRGMTSDDLWSLYQKEQREPGGDDDSLPDPDLGF
jgi:hypothetical protein